MVLLVKLKLSLLIEEAQTVAYIYRLKGKIYSKKDSGSELSRTRTMVIYSVQKIKEQC